MGDEENLSVSSVDVLTEVEKRFVKQLKKEKMMRQNMNFSGFLSSYRYAL